MDRMTKLANFLPVKTIDTVEDYARLYFQEIVRLYGVSFSIISNWKAQFIAQFWKSFQRGLVSRVKLSTALHRQTDGQAKRMIQTLENRLREYVIDFKALYERRCRLLNSWFKVGKTELIGLDLVHQAMEKIMKRFGNMAYELELPSELTAIHAIFHISMLKKYLGDPLFVILTEGIGVKEILSYKEILVQILDRQSDSDDEESLLVAEEAKGPCSL
ncbi:uncharacterized protein LOC129884190 [Solanum dulcamara]|uniref:uncharacterized protein LOC129884190 n=1 Tax=Solanum dulcamara TaxID=45834 RepID=UPI0024865C3F|nr:uncharacterized protein LOC129884190 [Solanum dulcamara]